MLNRLALLAVAALAPLFAAGPVDFGLAELERAVSERGLRPGAVRVRTEISSDSPETYRIRPGVIAGGDLRGLMYGLLEAAEQIRETGRLPAAKGSPTAALRSVRRTLSTGELAQEWSVSGDYWRRYAAMLARNRFNRLTLVFPARGEQWRGVLEAAAPAAADYGIDLALGVRPDAPPLGDLRAALRAHPSIRTVQASPGASVEWYAELLAVIAKAGRLVTVDIPSPDGTALALANGGRHAVRISAPFWPGGLARPYQPAETLPGRGYRNLLERPRRRELYWDLGASGLRARWLSGDAGLVRRAVAALSLGDAAGFEIDAPGWKDFDRHWLFYTLWGRLAFDPKTPDRFWLSEMKRRYGAAASGVSAAYQAATAALAEIAAADLDFPLEAWRDARPADWRTTAGVAEAVGNRLHGVASAKETPLDLAASLLALAADLDAALSAARGHVTGDNREWASALSDFETVASLARYHAHRHLVVAHTAWFDQTGDAAALAEAQRELAAARAAWQKLAATQEGAAALQTLPPIARDLESIALRARLAEELGPFEFGFDFGSPAGRSAAPRFESVGAKTLFTESRGFGWVGEGEREAGADAAGPPLHGDWIRGRGPQRFRLKAPDGAYRALLVNPKGPATPRALRARNGHLDVVFPAGEWTLSGLTVQPENAAARAPHRPWPNRPPRPTVAHTPPASAASGRPLSLSLRIARPAGVAAVRLHYRPLNQLAEFKTIESAGAKGAFTIPAADLSPRWDLLYYFEILGRDSGWLEPDPRAATPYYVLRVQ